MQSVPSELAKVGGQVPLRWTYELILISTVFALLSLNFDYLLVKPPPTSLDNCPFFLEVGDERLMACITLSPLNDVPSVFEFY